jgi:hypothetical protein
MHKNKIENLTNEKRSDHRKPTPRDFRIEIKFVGEPIYQFRIMNVTDKGASILVKDDSAFLNLIEVGQIADVNFIAPQELTPSGSFEIEVKHISELSKSIYKGHRLVGISILKKFGSE